MKYTLYLLLSITLLASCKETQREVTSQVTTAVETAIDYPADLDKVFDNHGSVDKWKSMKAMTFEIEKEGGNEKTMLDLHSRHERIEASKFTSGYNGKDYWVVADTSYKGNAKFYTNLMFYFYAMPFVLSDDGINYDKVDPLTFEDVAYPGYRISYGDGVGISPKDEYFIHYDPETYEMAWLGYTVTYYSDEKSDKLGWIRYNDWKNFNGLKLPNSLTWYKTEDNKPTEVRNARNFVNVKVSETAFPVGTFDVPEGADIVE